jgi:hypothetical protein
MNHYEVALDGGAGPVVVLAELTPSQMLLAGKLVGREPSIQARGMKLAWNGVKMGVKAVDGVTLKPTDPPHRVVTRSAWLNQLSDAWSQIHTPKAEEVEAVVDGLAPSVGPEGERWAVTLPDGRVVVMAEIEPDTVAAAISEAEMSANSEAAQIFQGMISGPARAIRSVAGVPKAFADFRSGKGPETWKGWDGHFSVRETYLLGAAFNKIHGSTGLGEVTPVASNG